MSTTALGGLSPQEIRKRTVFLDLTDSLYAKPFGARSGELITALESSTGSKETVIGIQYVGRLCRLTLNSVKAQETLSSNGIVVAGERFSATPAIDTRNVTVHVQEVPLWVGFECIQNALASYGEVLGITFAKTRLPSGVFILNGTRLVTIRRKAEKATIPSYISVSGRRVRVWHHGQQQTCRVCDRVGHVAKNCTSTTTTQTTTPPTNTDIASSAECAADTGTDPRTAESSTLQVNSAETSASQAKEVPTGLPTGETTQPARDASSTSPAHPTFAAVTAASSSLQSKPDLSDETADNHTLENSESIADSHADTNSMDSTQTEQTNNDTNLHHNDDLVPNSESSVAACSTAPATKTQTLPAASPPTIQSPATSLPCSSVSPAKKRRPTEFDTLRSDPTESYLKKKKH